MLHQLIVKIETEIRNLEVGICNNPPDSYDKFRELVGRRNGLVQAIDIINELVKAEDER